jgi:hypothetical protein
MSGSKKWAAALIALGLGATFTAKAAEPVPGPQQPTTQELMAQVEALKAKVNQMEQTQTKYDSRDVDATVAAVLKDADRHSMLIDGTGVTSGFSVQKGFFISNEDQSFLFHPSATFQFRGVGNYRQDAKNGNNSDTETGFAIHRAKFGFDGSFGKDIGYKFLWQDPAGGNGGTPALQYAYVQYVLARGVFGNGMLAVRAGQDKDIVSKEEVIGDVRQMFTERSLANFLLGGGALGPEVQSVNFMLIGNDNPLHVQLALEDGTKTSNTDFQNIVGTTHVNFGVAGRADYKFFGDWSAADDLSGVWTKNDLLVVGGGADFTQSDNTNAVRYSVDVQYELAHKLVVYAAGYGDYIEFRNLAATAPTQRQDFGGVVEAGYFFTPAFEAIARYSLVKMGHNFRGAGGVSQFHELAAGFNFFLGPDGSFGDRAKVTVDLTYLPNGSPAFPGGDFLASPNKKDELVARVQLQLWL